MKTYTSEERRELDGWIAENVMGWTRKDVEPSHWFPDGWKNAWINPNGGATTLPAYTTDYATALMVLEACMKNKVNAGDISFCSTENNHFWFRTVKGNRHIDGEAATLPLAICEFAKGLFSK